MSHPFADFYKGKRVVVTGHTGFQGGWVVAWLKLLGAQVCGYGLPPAGRPNFFDATLLDRGITSIFGDIRDRNSLANMFTEFQPEIVIHCAAQTSPQSWHREPVDGFSTNVMGTVHILEEARLTHSVRAVVLVSSDSCPEHEAQSPQEGGERGAQDLYSASLASAELARSAFNKSYFQKTSTAVATARSVDAIGGGDWREGQAIPDLVRAITSGAPVPGGSGRGLRLWHVLEPVRGYLLLAQKLFERSQQYSGVWDFGPDDKALISSAQLSKTFEKRWHVEEGALAPQKTRQRPSRAPKLSPHKAQAELGWSPVLSRDEALAWTIEWYRGFCSDPSASLRTTEDQLQQYMQMTTAQGF
jgi:CDP-glucose 4,6-dehydratase